MKKSLIALALVSAFTAPAFAQEAAAPVSDHTLTGNVGLFSSYRFRGIDQTMGKPALQGGFDYSHASGIYVGNWNSVISVLMSVVSTTTTRVRKVLLRRTPALSITANSTLAPAGSSLPRRLPTR